MRTLVRRGLPALLALLVAACSSSKSTPGTTPTVAPSTTPNYTTTVPASSAGQTIDLIDPSGNSVVLTFPEAANTVDVGTELTVTITQTLPTPAPAAVRRAGLAARPLQGGSFDEFFSISATLGYTLTAPPGIVITAPSSAPFAAGTYAVQLGTVGGSSWTSLGTATIATNVLTYSPTANGTPPQVPLVTGTTDLIEISN
jgi:hypothetical protein